MNHYVAALVAGALLLIPGCNKKDDSTAAPGASVEVEGTSASATTEGERRRHEHEREGDGGREHGEHQAK
jgi:hypothetical protein